MVLTEEQNTVLEYYQNYYKNMNIKPSDFISWDQIPKELQDCLLDLNEANPINPNRVAQLLSHIRSIS